MNPFRSPLYRRVLVWFCLANLLVLLLGGMLARGLIEYTSVREIDWSALAQAAGQAYDNGGSNGLRVWSQNERRDGIEATLFQNGQPLAPVHLHPVVRAQLPMWLDSHEDVIAHPWHGVYLAVLDVHGADGTLRRFVAFSHSHVRLPASAQARILLGAQALLSLLFIGLVGWWVARGVARPVGALREATRRMSAGELSARVGTVGGRRDELAGLAADFDAMAERIEALVAHERGVLQDLSHELRSPLARLHLLLDFARRSADADEAAAYFRQAEQELIRLDRMTGEMLALSRLEGGIPGLQREPVELAGLVDACVAQARLEAQAKHIALEQIAHAPAMVSGNASLLERALENLIANAIKYSPPGGRIEVALYAGSVCAELAVRDYGPGVPEAEVGALFRPFFRGSNAGHAEGHGLGLAIVRRVVAAHGGDIHAQNAAGGGLEVRLRLPLAAPG